MATNADLVPGLAELASAHPSKPRTRATRRASAKASVPPRPDVPDLDECVRRGVNPNDPSSPRYGDRLSAYHTFLQRKSQLESGSGFAPIWMPDFLFDFQGALVDWALQKGRAAILADCGLGKTPMQLVWAENIVRKTNRPVLILTPLAVSSQTLREAEKFGIGATRATGRATNPGIYVTNYERLHHFDPDDFSGVVCDESSILKAFDGETRAAVTRFMSKHAYRLLCTATAAPNDYVELGTASEALGGLGFMDMLNRFFKNNRNNSSTGQAWGTSGGGQVQWRFRGHAEEPFWRWVCSWARSLRKPSDLGFADDRFVLPPLVEREHTVAARVPREGFLFSMPAIGLQEEREERRRTLAERCETAAALVVSTGKPAVVWCQLNDEGDLLERLIPDSVQVAGKDPDEVKEERFTAFASGAARVLVTKPVIGAWGLNWQHCAHMTTFASHSFEQYYQSIRRSWRFGQTQPVTVDVIISDGERHVLANLQRKARQADTMMSNLTAHMHDALAIEARRKFTTQEEVPSWL